MTILRYRQRTISCILFVAVSAVRPELNAVAAPLAVGSGSFEFVDPEGNADRPITVWFHRPTRFRPSGAVLFVMHGVERNGREYRDAWVKCSEARGFLLLTPEFSLQNYPESEMYIEGFMNDSKGGRRPRSKWTFTAIERIFEQISPENELKQKVYSIYGHSAGAQFVHRLVTFMPDAHVKLAISANAGWYTMPKLDVRFPYGLKGTDVGASQLTQALGKPLVVLLGTNDTDVNHQHLRRTGEAMAQGPRRLARGKMYFAAAKAAATQLNTPLRWRMVPVRGVGHSNSKMAQAAAKMIR